MEFANDWFFVGQNYIKIANILIDGMIKDKNLVISKELLSDEECEERRKFCANNVCLPCLFCLYQGIELILKGFVYSKQEGKHAHNIETLYGDFAEYNNEQFELISLLKKFIFDPINLIKKYKLKNEIITMSDFYNFLRYPDKKIFRNIMTILYYCIL